jgi:hypothetical protein
MEGGDMAKYLITLLATVEADDMGKAFTHAINLGNRISDRENIPASALDVEEITQDEANDLMSGL